MKKEYLKPELNAQSFAPNENVAACYLVQCPLHFNPSYSEYSHSGRGQYWEKSRQEMLDAGLTEAQLDKIDAGAAGADMGGYTITTALGNDGVMKHTNVFVKWDNVGTNFGS